MNMSSDHPKFLELKKSGLTDEEDIRRVLQVFLTLCEVHEWWNVRLHPHPEHNITFISGHADRRLAREFVVTLGTDQSLSPLQIQSYIELIQEKHSPDVSDLTVALIDTDSNTAFYKMSAGLVPPPSLPLVGEMGNYTKGNKSRKKRQFTYPESEDTTKREEPGTT